MALIPRRQVRATVVGDATRRGRPWNENRPRITRAASDPGLAQSGRAGVRAREGRLEWLGRREAPMSAASPEPMLGLESLSEPHPAGIITLGSTTTIEHSSSRSVQRSGRFLDAPTIVLLIQQNHNGHPTKVPTRRSAPIPRATDRVRRRGECRARRPRDPPGRRVPSPRVRMMTPATIVGARAGSRPGTSRRCSSVIDPSRTPIASRASADSTYPWTFAGSYGSSACAIEASEVAVPATPIARANGCTKLVPARRAR